jgi:tetratricopeptide (TPR) repeat protein
MDGLFYPAGLNAGMRSRARQLSASESWARYRRASRRSLPAAVPNSFQAGFIAGLRMAPESIPEPAVVDSRSAIDIARQYQRDGDHRRAVRWYVAAIRGRECDPVTLYFAFDNTAKCLLKLGLPQAAAAQCSRAISVDPRRHNAYKNLGLALEAQDKTSAAAVAYLDATDRYGSDARALELLEGLLQREPTLLHRIPHLAGRIQDARSGREAPSEPTLH